VLKARDLASLVPGSTQSVWWTAFPAAALWVLQKNQPDSYAYAGPGTGASEAVNCPDGAPPFHPPQHLEPLGYLHLGKRPADYPEKGILLQSNTGALGMARGDLDLMHAGQPFTGHGFKGTRRGKPASAWRTAHGARAMALGHQPVPVGHASST
jgi:hypothetical protein